MKQLIWYVFLFITISTAAQAKWASYGDAPIKTSYDQEINVNSDGTTEETITFQFEILKESGRNVATNYILEYNSTSEKITILEAKTIYQGKEYELDKNLMEDKPLASTPGGFDQKRQILLTFPKAEIGARIFLKYKMVTTEVPLEGFYADVFTFGNSDFIIEAHVKLHSQLPLHILVNDPEKALSITKDKDESILSDTLSDQLTPYEFYKNIGSLAEIANVDDGCHNIEITLIKPLYKVAINEHKSGIINNKYLTWVSVSSLTEWEDLAARFGQQYTRVFMQPLPNGFLQIANMAAQKKNDLEQINTVTSLLNDKIQYTGDWSTTKGCFVPRDLDEIGKTQLGDCKDFAAATAAILTELGYKAQIAVVRRGINDFYPESLPDFSSFNHALVKVTSKQGKVYWIDPTNFQSMANGIFPDVANKMALILDPKQPRYEKIPSISQDHPQYIFKRQIEIGDDNKIAENGNVTFKNEAAYQLTGSALRRSEEAIKDLLFNSLSYSRLEAKNKKNLHLPDLQSRIVKDILYDYSFEQENGVFKTNLGQALKLNYARLSHFYDATQDGVTDVLFDMPFTYIRQTIIKNINVQNFESLNKEIKTPWLYVSRKCSFNNYDLQIDDTIIVYKNLIANEELKTSEFIKLKDELEKNFKDVAIVFNKNKS